MDAGVLLLLAVYFLPSAIAAFGRHYNKDAIFILNLLLGWTVLGWIVALVWSFTKPPPNRAATR